MFRPSALLNSGLGLPYAMVGLQEHTKMITSDGLSHLMRSRSLPLLGIGVAVIMGVVACAEAANAQSHPDLLYQFASPGPMNPRASLLQAIDGNFYGTTASGGASDAGTLFRMTPAGTVTVLHEFTGGTTDGANPVASLIQATDGNFYGTTYSAGSASFGTVFQMTLCGIVTTLHAFTGTDGAGPSAALLEAMDGNLYGTTSSGLYGTSDFGTVFRMTFGGTVTVLNAFTGGTGGETPVASLIQASDGNFYGTTSKGGVSSAHAGTIFQMTPGGSVTVLHTFLAATSDGDTPETPLLQAADGNFYGTTSFGGTSGYGTVFQMTPAGTVTILHTFNGGTTDGAVPYASLIQATDGNLYGTTLYGGASGAGVVFRLSLPAVVLPAATTLISPSGVGTLNAPTYTWTMVSAATAYYLTMGTARLTSRSIARPPAAGIS